MRRLPSFCLGILILAMIISLPLLSCAQTVEPDDSNLFVEAFGAYQKKDYLLAISKIRELTQVFPDTPLKDVALLLMARSGLKAGDNMLAAQTVNQFSTEFPANPLRSSIEDELLTLGTQLQKGGRLAENKTLHAAAVKVRNEQLAIERAIAAKLEQERLARLKAEQERIAREKAELERRERERIAAEKAAKDAIRTATIISLEENRVATAGQSLTLPFEIVNHTSNDEEYTLDINAPADYGAILSTGSVPGTAISRAAIGAGQSFTGSIQLRIPSSRVDGEHSGITLKIVSARFSEISLSKNSQLITSAPLVRAVARPSGQQILPGGQARYRITVLNIGSKTARQLSGRIILPPQLSFTGGENQPFRQESRDTLSFAISDLETGKIAEYYLDLKVANDSRIGQEIRCRIEITNGELQRTENFDSTVATVQAN